MMCSSTLWQFTEQVTDNIMLTFSFILSLFQAFIFQFFCTFTPSMTLPSTDNTRSWEFTLYLEMTVVNLIFGWKRRWLLHSFLYFDKDSFISPSIIVQIDKTVNKYTSSNQGRHYYTWRQRRLGTYERVARDGKVIWPLLHCRVPFGGPFPTSVSLLHAP